MIGGKTIIFSASVKVGGQEKPGIYMVKQESLKEGETAGCELTAPNRARAIIVVAPDHREAQTALGGVIVHGNFGVINKQGKTCPMALEAFKNFARW